tara:strand:- start:46 stop:459 length:414 start_codon:yes stop_codon:yes gene_type:complete
MKKLLSKDENQVRYLLENGLTEITFFKAKNNKPFTFKFASYWHPYELRHYFRDYAAYSPLSYVRLGKKLNDIGLITNSYPKPTKQQLSTILDAISKYISMNLKLFNYDSISKANNRTLKEIYKTRENLRLDMNNWIS